MSEAPHYAEAFSLIPGRCFRFVSHQEAGGPNHCPEPPTWLGAFRVKGGRRYAVEACDGHRASLEHGRRSLPSTGAQTGSY